MESRVSIDLFTAEAVISYDTLVTGRQEESGNFVEKSLQREAGLEKRACVHVETRTPTFWAAGLPKATKSRASAEALSCDKWTHET